MNMKKIENIIVTRKIIRKRIIAIFDRPSPLLTIGFVCFLSESRKPLVELNL